MTSDDIWLESGGSQKPLKVQHGIARNQIGNEVTFATKPEGNVP
jgi:hypothetical protein